MIDFSKVKSIAIPEGNVSKILFGASVLWQKAFATHRNLYNINDKYNSFNHDADDWITVEMDNTSGTSAIHDFPNINPSALIEPDKTYLLVCEVKELTLEFIQVFSNYAAAMKAQFGSSDLIVYEGNGVGTYVHPITSRSDVVNCVTMLRTVVKCGAGQKGKAVFRISVIEDTTVTAEDFVYQPFVSDGNSDTAILGEAILGKAVLGKR